MNKKIATLGLAAVLGLAGVVALPVFAASNFKIKEGEVMVQQVGDQYAGVTPVEYTGLLIVDDTAVTKDALLDYLNGKDAVALKLKATKKLAEEDPTNGKLEGKKNVTIKGTYADIKTSLNALPGYITNSKEQRAALKLTEVVIESSTDLTFTAAGLYNDLKALVASEKFENVKFKLMLNDAQAKKLNLTGDAVTEFPAELSGKVEITKAKIVEFTDADAKVDFMKKAKISYDAAIVAGQLEKANTDEQQNNNQNQNQDNKTDKTEDKAGDKNKKPEGGIKTPDTGIAE